MIIKFYNGDSFSPKYLNVRFYSIKVERDKYFPGWLTRISPHVAYLEQDLSI